MLCRSNKGERRRSKAEEWHHWQGCVPRPGHLPQTCQNGRCALYSQGDLQISLPNTKPINITVWRGAKLWDFRHFS
jgi:hypothetical protein